MQRFILASLVMPLAIAIASAACGGGDKKSPSTRYPGAGEDRFERTTATVEIEVTPPESARPGFSGLGQTETIELAGPALIKRSDPRQDGDVFVVGTEIIEMELTGEASFGPVIVREGADRESKGEVRQQKAGKDFPASSFFDVFVEVELPNLDLTLHNEEPLRMSTTLQSLPPSEGEGYRGEDDRPLYTPAGLAVGRIIDALHIPAPEGAPSGGATATSTSDGPTATPGAPRGTPTRSGPGGTTEGTCEHGTGQSVLFIVFRGLRPGQTVKGDINVSPADGLVSVSDFEVIVDDNGEAIVQKDIKKFGTYGWTSDAGLDGEYTVAQTCPGPPQSAAAGADNAKIVAFMKDFASARRTADGPKLFESLHPIVLAHYGDDACRTFYDSQIGADPTFAFAEGAMITGPESYTYVSGGVTVGTADAYKVIVDTTNQGQAQAFTWHFAIVDGVVKAFQPCAR